MSQNAVSEIIDYFGGIVSTADVNRELKKRGHKREAGQALNAMRIKGELEVIDTCVKGILGGKARIWIKYYEDEIRLQED